MKNGTKIVGKHVCEGGGKKWAASLVFALSTNSLLVSAHFYGTIAAVQRITMYDKNMFAELHVELEGEWTVITATTEPMMEAVETVRESMVSTTASL